MQNLIKKINQLLPQTQCTRCGYEGCLPYAQAIATGIPHNQCPPGGQSLIDELSALLDRPNLSLNPENGSEGPPKIAVIDEDQCIGCTICIQACPVDAIFGTAKKMHSVIQSECNGCELCVQPCPVDCITIQSQDSAVLSPDERKANAKQYLKRIDARNQRINTRQLEKLKAHRKAKQPTSPNGQNTQSNLDYIKAATLRAKTKKGLRHESKTS